MEEYLIRLGLWRCLLKWTQDGFSQSNFCFGSHCAYDFDLVVLKVMIEKP